MNESVHFFFFFKKAHTAHWQFLVDGKSRNVQCYTHMHLTCQNKPFIWVCLFFFWKVQCVCHSCMHLTWEKRIIAFRCQERGLQVYFSVYMSY